ncbi:MAG: SDR family oxidoreductase [Armatimonadetes bacterium]|nr:SDR family oxidoreductase [Armatimonadota bacterium]
MSGRLAGQTALVTGGAIRVGRAIVERLAAEGAQVGFTYLSSAETAAELVQTLRKAGVRSRAVRCDQREPTQIRDAVADITGRLGPVDLLVNSAAVFRRTPLSEATVEEWDHHLDTNLRGPWLFMQAVGPSMKERGTGAIVNLLDVAAERPYPGYLPYCASKAGLECLTRGVARVLAPEVRVNGIAIGTVLWPEEYPDAARENTVARTPLARVGTPEDVAAAVAYLAAEASFVTGAILTLDGGRRLV